MRCARQLLLLGAMVFASAPALAQQPPEGEPPNLFELRSSLKATFLMARAPELTVFTPERVSAASFWRLRLEPRVLLSRWVTIFAAYEQRVRLASSSAGLSSPGLPPSEALAPYRIVELAGALSSAATYSYWHELDRLAVSLHLPYVELTVGRQALGWGRGMIFGAVDVFAPFTPLEVDREWRRGVDAVRADVRLGAKVSAEVVGVFGTTVERSAFAGRVRGYFGPLDAEVVGGYRARDWFTGLSMSASLFDAELHGELAAFFLPEAWAWGGTFGQEKLVLKGVLGASYQFAVGEGLRVVVEYHFNGFGLLLPVAASELASRPEFSSRFARGDFQTLGRHLLAASASYSFSMATAASLQVLVDPSDGSGVVAPNASWDLADNVSLLASVYVGWGRGPKDLELRSQFGSTPLTVLLQLRLYDQRSVERSPRDQP